MPPIRSTSPQALAVLALFVSACGSDVSLPVPVDHTDRGASQDGATVGTRDAGDVEVDAEPAAETDGDDVDDDTNESAEPSTVHREDAGANPTKDAGQSNDAGANAIGACDTLTYESFGKTFVETYCTECHNSTSRTSGLGGIVLDSLPLIVKHKMYLKRTVAPRADGREPPMPKGGNPQLTDEERTKFGAWIDCGPI